jgi:hypothetical protein
MSSLKVTQKPGTQVDLDDEPKPVYYDPRNGKFYWIEWEDTGNNDIPHRHYLDIEPPPQRVCQCTH